MVKHLWSAAESVAVYVCCSCGARCSAYFSIYIHCSCGRLFMLTALLYVCISTRISVSTVVLARFAIRPSCTRTLASMAWQCTGASNTALITNLHSTSPHPFPFCPPLLSPDLSSAPRNILLHPTCAAVFIFHRIPYSGCRISLAPFPCRFLFHLPLTLHVSATPVLSSSTTLSPEAGIVTDMRVVDAMKKMDRKFYCPTGANP